MLKSFVAAFALMLIIAGGQFGERGKAFAEDFSQVYVRAFIAASENLSDQQEAVVAEMDKFTASLEEMVRREIIKSVYDCLPELRIVCFDAIRNAQTSSAEEGVIQEWGEWWDATDDAGKREMVAGLFSEAVSRGFNLLSNEELSAAALLPP